MIMTAEQQLEGYRLMRRIREAENAIAEDFKQKKIFSFLHLSTGQEAVAVGVSMALDRRGMRGDRMFGNHRSHGHYLAKGGSLKRMVAEVYGHKEGCCAGQGGSMHMLDTGVGFVGTTPILGSIAPIAAGSAFEQKTRHDHEITVAFIGDGASEEGVVYETLNLMAVMKLPLLLVIEDNGYAVATSERKRRSERFDRGALVKSLGCSYFTADGSRLQSVFEFATFALEQLPAVLCVKTHRHMAHSGPITDESHREHDTKEQRDALDPLTGLRQELAHTVPEHALATIDAVEHGLVRDALEALQGAAYA